MSDYHDCDSRDDCDAAREERDELKAENERLRAAAERVCWFDWSGNDEDAVKAVDDLRAALDHQQESGDK